MKHCFYLAEQVYNVCNETAERIPRWILLPIIIFIPENAWAICIQTHFTFFPFGFPVEKFPFNKLTAVFYGIYSYLHHSGMTSKMLKTQMELPSFEVLWCYFMVYNSIDHRKLLSICFFTITRKKYEQNWLYFC